MSDDSPRWRKLWVRGDYNPAIKADAIDASGAYAIRHSDTHDVKYVGESSRGVLWKTMLRHFQAPESFARERERGVFATTRQGVFTGNPQAYDVALWVTSKGPRPRHDDSTRADDLKGRGKRFTTKADQAASEAQARWLATLRPDLNVDDGLAKVDVAAELRATRARQEEEDRDDPFGLKNPGAPLRVTKPQGDLTELGKLTRLVPMRGRQFRWTVQKAPSLAYDKPGRLFIVYPGKILRTATADEQRRYAKTHWGELGSQKMRDAGISPGPWTRVAAARSITYTTRKGSDELVDWEHEFGEGSRKRLVRPVILLHACAGGCAKACGARHGMALGGGSYHVTDRGIVG